jgi:hypothetical protein
MEETCSRLDRLILKHYISICIISFAWSRNREQVCLKHSAFLPRKDNENMTDLATCYYRSMG